jgi:membrane protein insertase Oxa1/YidC/SpoIIIJ
LTSPPLYCSTKIAETAIPSNKTNNHVAIILVVTIVALIIVVALGICLYKKFIKSELTKDMASRVGEIVANYANKVTSQKKRQRERLSETLDEEL